MVVDFKGKKINVPDKDIQNSMKSLGLSKADAVKMWLEDEGYLNNEEQNALDKKAKDAKITATIHKASAVDKTKKTQKERTRKADPVKEMIISKIAELLRGFAEDIEILNVGKLISFKIGADKFEIDLKRTRKPKK